MTGFVTDLKVELIDGAAESGRGLWKLTAPLIYDSELPELIADQTEYIIVPTGYETDFASVPRIPIAFLLAGDTASQAAALHDYLYESAIFSRKTSDEIFREAAQKTGTPWWRTIILYAGVRIFGGAFYDPNYKQMNTIAD